MLGLALMATGCSPSTGTDPATLTDATAHTTGHVHALDIDPSDGALYVAAHMGVFRITGAADGQVDVAVTRVADRWQDTMAFTVTGRGRFLASGHPDLREDLPARLGLIASYDRAQSWQAVSLQGSADFHALAAQGNRVYGYDAVTGRLRVSIDAGATWDRGIEAADVVDLAVDPADQRRVWATPDSGRVVEFDCSTAVATRADVPGPPLVMLDWHSADLLLGVGVDGDVYGSRDRGRSWHRTPGPPGAAEAIPPTGSGGTWPRPRGCTPPATRGGPGTSCCLTPGAPESSV